MPGTQFLQQHVGKFYISTYINSQRIIVDPGCGVAQIAVRRSEVRFGLGTLWIFLTVKKERQIFLIYKGIHKGSGEKSYSI